ncbi:hypothetical protein [Neomicrococcus lactis]|nr:hypothetical protein [Neomicrococcus lactis]
MSHFRFSGVSVTTPAAMDSPTSGDTSVRDQVILAPFDLELT